MADLSQTAANVATGNSTRVSRVQAGEAITQGQPVYKSASDSKYYRCDSDAEASAAAAGIALSPAGADADYFVLAEGDGANVDLGATLTVGETYCVSTNVGAIAPIADLTTGDYVTHLGVASATDNLVLNINATGTAKP